MEQRSIWQAAAAVPGFSPLGGKPLDGKLAVDTAIVGAGITGLTAAMLLAREGRSVAVVEAKEVGSGTTGASTGNLYPMVGASLASIADKWDEETMRRVAASRALALDVVERTVHEHRIECGFARRAWHLFAMPGVEAERQNVEREYRAALAARLPARMVEGAPLPFATGATLIVERAAQFNPAEYVRGLARAIASERCRIFAHSPVQDVDEAKRVLHTANGEVHADSIVLATHVPKGFSMVQTELGPYREYALAARLAADVYPEGIFWGAGQSRHSIRSYAAEGSRYLIVIGESHKTGQEADTEACYRRVESYLGSHFPIAAITHRWSAQGYYPADLLPYIGAAGADRIYIATGYGADGLTYGTLAGCIVAAEILGRPHAYADLYEATRVTPIKSARNVIHENVNVVAEYIKDYIKRESRALLDIAPGEGRIVEVEGDRVAAYRDESGELSVLSPVCTHLKCLVHWNAAERTWDCPCHGSRFATDGEVIEGPALSALKPVAVRESE